MNLRGSSECLSVFQNFGIWQIALILVIVLLLFGVGKLPQVGKGMGQAINEFKSAIGSKNDESNPDDKNDDAAAR
ncbi:MAG: twin-arginine translocase TatA/TatE family subunit [SAR202 cluster bacterium]|nr:MAG: twin-arginine translocase TatA/TatE family subunit [SAR202 cluster bacterium]KAA1301419.1 MAG: twin-arginine translocase TatA/TatE family subunit [SAR202 cluster bacterium]KAA1301760.1 MAG: twin-arginine translocase TatA/TatE family subunit [SAR202 cluster bacterium]MBF07115.1 twin-arginine translocase TatA/TatE family subunit [Chloroflexota bacterium]